MSGFDCCTNMQMCLLFTFNFIIWAFGLACLGVGIWALVDPHFVNTIESILSTGVDSITLSTVQGAAALLIVVGAVTFVVAFCGCCGAIKRSKCLLRIYIGVMVILMVLQLTAVVLAFVFKGTIDAVAGDIFKYWVENDVRADNKYANEEERYATEIVAQNQFSEGCCGVSGPSSYMNSTYYKDTNGTCLVPPTCCTQEPNAAWNAPKPVNLESCCQGNANYTNNGGCSISFDSILMFPYWLLYVVGICFIVFQILVTVFACVVHNAIGDYDYR